MNIKMKTKTKREREREAREREKKATRERHTKKLASLAPKKKGSFGVNGSFDRPPGVAIVSLRVIVGDGLESYTNGIHWIVIRKCAVASERCLHLTERLLDRIVLFGALGYEH